MKLLYLPFRLIAAFIGARIAKSLFTSLWSKIDDAPPPDPTAPSATIGKSVGGRALEAATVAAAAAAAERLGATVFHHLFGAWPGKDPEPTEK